MSREFFKIEVPPCRGRKEFYNVKTFIEDLYLNRTFIQEVTVSIEAWNIIQYIKFKDPKFHLNHVVNVYNDESQREMRIFGVRVIRGEK